VNVQRKPGLLLFAVIIFDLSLVMGCHTGPPLRGDTGYRAIEREADRNSADLAITGSDIAAGAERIDSRAERVQSELDSLAAAVAGSALEGPAREALRGHVAMAQGEAAALRREAAALRGDAGRLNEQLAEERKIRAALSAEHDRREAAMAAVKAELAKEKGQRRLFLAVLIAVGVGVLGCIVFRILRVLRIIPV
jgi:hypothetical protein